MKTRFAYRRLPRRPSGAAAVIVLLALLTVMVMLIMANAAALNRLSREVKGMEKRQIQRLEPSTNSPGRAAASATNLPPSR